MAYPVDVFVSQQAVNSFGGREGSVPPDLSWLPPYSPLRMMPSMGSAADASEFDVLFWAAPFGVETKLVVGPGFLLTSFAEFGVDRELSETVRAVERSSR